MTEQALDATARFLDKPRTDVLEDIGTYLASHPNVEALRRLLRFGGAHFIEFLYSLDDLHDRARLAVDDLELPRLTLVRHTENHYSLLCGAAFPGWGHVLVGILRVMADDYGALACPDRVLRAPRDWVSFNAEKRLMSAEFCSWNLSLTTSIWSKMLNDMRLNSQV